MQLTYEFDERIHGYNYAIGWIEKYLNVSDGKLIYNQLNIFILHHMYSFKRVFHAIVLIHENKNLSKSII